MSFNVIETQFNVPVLMVLQQTLSSTDFGVQQIGD